LWKGTITGRVQTDGKMEGTLFNCNRNSAELKTVGKLQELKIERNKKRPYPSLSIIN
jgi:hypothetical protein